MKKEFIKAAGVRPGIFLSMIFLLGLGFCANPQEERFYENQDIGIIDYNNSQIKINHCPVSLDLNRIECRAQSPNLSLEIASRNPTPASYSFLLKNMPRNSLPIVSRGTIQSTAVAGNYLYEVTLNASESAIISIDGMAGKADYRFGVVGDIQGNRATAKLIQDHVRGQNLDFFIVIGDMVESNTSAQYQWAKEFTENFPVPIYLVFGNHDGFNSGYDNFAKIFGKTNYHFFYNQDLFLVLDSANQGISRSIFDYVREILKSDAAFKLVFTHVPPFDPWGMRNNGFNSRFEAAMLQNILINNNVQIIFSGHTHSYLDLYIEKVRNIIVGTGGGWPEKLDGIGFGYLVVERGISGINAQFFQVAKD